MGTGALLALGALVWASADLAQLQRGLEEAPQERIALAAQDSVAGHPVQPMSAYPSFQVRSAPGVDVVVHYRESPSAKANLTFVHGASSGAWAWARLFVFFGPEYNLYALSWRGHFDSAPQPGDADSWDYVQDQLSSLSAVQARSPLPTHVIAHSYGAATAVLAAHREPQGVASMQLLAPVVPLDYSRIQSAVVPRIMPRILSRDGPPDPLAPAEQPFAGMFVDQQQMQKIWVDHAGQTYSVESPLLIAQDGVSPQWQGQLKQAYESLKMPVFFLTARYDNVVVPRRQHTLAQSIQAPLVELESGHYLPLDVAWQQTAEQIQANLESL
ncbi:MAG: pimeloyl-ACP methyl ester carboxylesterase [Cognaticolwellia sp.]|jgi:pimeloyl-ACP methyl ester carboxylesterase